MCVPSDATHYEHKFHKSAVDARQAATHTHSTHMGNKKVSTLLYQGYRGETNSVGCCMATANPPPLTAASNQLKLGGGVVCHSFQARPHLMFSSVQTMTLSMTDLHSTHVSSFMSCLSRR